MENDWSILWTAIGAGIAVIIIRIGDYINYKRKGKK